jgi:pSer/pThr/pTyr-binding forkhead associated (FHA) protein
MDAKLVVIGGDAQAAEYSLRLPTIVGRSRSADLKLVHPLVSRRHCEFFEDGGQLMVRDLGSLNGTFVGDSRISEVMALAPGATITIGTVTLQAVYGDMKSARRAKSAKSESPATASPLEQTAELGSDEPGGEEAGGGFDLGWLEDAEEAPPEADAKSAAAQPISSVEELADDTVEAEPAAEVAFELPDSTATAQNGEGHEVNEFAPPEEQPAGGPDDEDLDDFFASLK